MMDLANIITQPPPYDPTWTTVPESTSVATGYPSPRGELLANEDEKKAPPYIQTDPLFNPAPSLPCAEAVQSDAADRPSAGGSFHHPMRSNARRPGQPHATRSTVKNPKSYPMEDIVWGPWGDIKSVQDTLRDDAGDTAEGKSCCRLFFAFLAYLAMGICGILLVVEYKGLSPDYATMKMKENPGKPVVIIITMIVSLFFIVLEGCKSKTEYYLCNMHPPVMITDRIELLKRQAPSIAWQVECYHYSRYNKSPPVPGHPEAKPTDFEKRNDKVVTYEECREFSLSECIDLTGPSESFPAGVMTKIATGVAIGFKDREAYDWFAKCRDDFFAECRSKDHYMDTHEFMDMDGMKQEFLVEPVKGSTVLCMKNICFCAWLVCLLSPIYRWCYFSISEERTKVFVKVIDV